MSNVKPTAILQIHTAAGGQDEHPFLKSDVCIGRAADNDFILESLQVSGRHLRLNVDADGSVTAMDLGSLNGTLLNGRPLSARMPAALQPGDRIQVAEFAIRVRLPAPEAPAPPMLAERVRIGLDVQPSVAVYTQEGVTKHPLSQAVMTIGSAPENDVVIRSTQISGQHARLVQDGDAWTIHDLGSVTGIIYAGRRVQQQTLHYGDIVHIGESVALQLRSSMGFVPAGAETPSQLGIRTVSVDLSDTLTIGRAPDNSVAIDHPAVSRHHALIERLGTRYRLRDLKSSNGVFVNNKRVDREAWLEEGDEIRVGPAKLRLAAGLMQHLIEAGVRLDAVRLSKQVSKSKNLLQYISLSIHPHEFVALVGLSGAGKTTLMDALSGFRPATGGRVLVNGVDLYRYYDMFRSDLGYVPQQSIVHTDLTVYKALDYAALLRMPPDTTKKERHQRIMEVLEELDLTDRKDLVIDKLSGGQMKRVSIAVELLTKPRLFFLDEPTSGLDPGTEYQMMRLLRKLADQGRTIVLITHATKNVMMCDMVLIIVRGGHVAYYGPPDKALAYFDQYRTDHERRIKDIEFDDTYTILEDEKRGTSQDWDGRYRGSSAYEKYVMGRLKELPQAHGGSTRAPARKRPRVSSVRQLSILTRRYLDLVVRNRALLAVLLAVMPVIGLLLVAIMSPNSFVGDTPAQIDQQLTAELLEGHASAVYSIVGESLRLMLMLVLAAVLLGLFAAAYEIVKERPIYRRERMVVVRILPYLTSKVIVLGAFALVQCLLLLLVIRLKVSYPAQGVVFSSFLEIYTTLVLATLAAIMLGLLISTLVPKTDTVIYAVFVVVFLQLLFAGVLFHLPPLGDRLSMLTLTRWGLEGMGSTVNVVELNELTRTRFEPEPITTEISIPVCAAEESGTSVKMVKQEVTIEADPVDIGKGLDFEIDFTSDREHLFRVWLILAGFGLACGLGSVVVLKRRDVI